MTDRFLTLHNAQAVADADCPRLSVDELRAGVLDEVACGARLAALCVVPREATHELLAVIARDAEGQLALAAAQVAQSYPALTPQCPQAHWFEREIFEQWGVRPEGHPWLKSVRFPLRSQAEPQAAACGLAEFYQLQGAEVHEVAVGPVHAGVIEPGHFRFQCHGETVHHLEISLGYQHRGIERALPSATPWRTLRYMETAAGDTTVGHATAHCRLLEGLSHTRVPLRAQAMRGVVAELERIANHTGDLGALAGDVGFLPTSAFCGRIRGDVLNLTAACCGNRFGRGMLRPGGVGWDLTDDLRADLQAKIPAITRDLRGAVNLLWETPSVMARFDGTGRVATELAATLGLVGVAARAAGLERDVRLDFPYGMYRFAHIPIALASTGDVFARAYVRWLEVQRSLAFLSEQLESFPEGPICAPCRSLAPKHLAVALVEGWRGEICHLALTDGDGRLAFYKIVDPSFHNWFGLAQALRGQAISDFPLCNKSFNLSYCGHDL